ncbi:MAG: exo-alpha-sialidase [Solirubrobacterales bacterium]|nr:exo-alpha-sialidase [Solirubrobacterales bacterium]MBV9714668.1 exo-alpha-sialidase [Solirubrobacterales bacterium]
MLLKRRVTLALVFAGLIGGGFLLLTRSHAQARNTINYARLNKIQKRIISETLASALGAASPGVGPTIVPGGNDNGGGADGAPNTPPSSYSSAAAAAGDVNYTPNASGKCASNFGRDVKVNENCLNVADSDLQGRSQANNETSIAQDPENTAHLVASDNNYVRGDGTCGAHFSVNSGQTWSDSTVPNGFTRGPTGFAREYWQAGGDTSVAWDTRGNAYLSCQLFNRGTVASPNADQSSTFVLFRSTGNGGASWDFPGRPSTVYFDPAGTSGVLEDKALMTVDDNLNSPYRDRIYVTWTEFAADGTAYIYEVHSDDYGQTFSARTVVSKDSPLCTNTFGSGTPNGHCNENQFSDPFVGPDGNLYVAYDNYNNQATSGTDNRYQVLLSKSTDGGQTFASPVKVGDYYDLPDCDTYQGTGADPARSCVPEKGPSTVSVFRATNYPSGQVDPLNPGLVTVAFGSYINPDSSEGNGCVPAGFATDGNPLYTGVKTAGACANKVLLGISRNGGTSFSTSTDPRDGRLVTQTPLQRHTDQYWQWSTFTRGGTLAVDYYDREYGTDEADGSSDFSLSGSSDLFNFGRTRVTTSSMPAPTEFEGPKGGQFYGDYTGLAALDQAHPIWMDTRSPAVFVCPGSATAGHPPTLCGATEPNGEAANDEEIYTATLNVPTGSAAAASHKRKSR